MTMNEALDRLCVQVESDIVEMKSRIGEISSPSTREALEESIGRLQEAVDLVNSSGLARPDRSFADSFLETVRYKL